MKPSPSPELLAVAREALSRSSGPITWRSLLRAAIVSFAWFVGGHSVQAQDQLSTLEEYLSNPNDPKYAAVRPIATKQEAATAFAFQVNPGWRETFHARYGFVPNDPYYLPNAPVLGLPGQWHLGTANVPAAWARDLTGLGVTVGIVDDGLQAAHPDLAPNFSASDSFDFGQGDADPTPVYFIDDHGTAVSGVAAGRGGNATGGTGVAPFANLAGLRVDFPLQTDPMFVNATLYHSNGVGLDGNNIKVKNHSYGISIPFISQPAQAAAVITSHNNGTVHTFAAGNERAAHGNFINIGGGPGFDPDVDYAIDADSNKKHLQSLQETLTVAALGSNGKFANYSDFGANIFVTAPSSSAGGFGIMTPDRTGEDGYNFTGVNKPAGELNYYSEFGGTSSASPLIAGVMTLGKQANPALNARMAKHLMVITNKLVDPTDLTVNGDGDGITPGSAWKTNGAGNEFNQNYGFGLIDADAFTIEAPKYSGVTPLAVELTGAIAVSTLIPDLGSLTKGFSLSNSGKLEEVEVTLDISHTWRGDIEAYLTSPSGTKSRLVHNNPLDSFDNLNWTFVSNAFWGEDPTFGGGNWLLEVRDTFAGDVGTWNSFSVLAKTGHLIAVPEPASALLLMGLVLGAAHSTRRRPS